MEDKIRKDIKNDNNELDLDQLDIVIGGVSPICILDNIRPNEGKPGNSGDSAGLRY